MKKIKCKLIFHGSYKEIDMGEFESITALKNFTNSCGWERPYTIVKLKDKN